MAPPSPWLKLVAVYIGISAFFALAIAPYFAANADPSYN